MVSSNEILIDADNELLGIIYDTFGEHLRVACAKERIYPFQADQIKFTTFNTVEYYDGHGYQMTEYDLDDLLTKAIGHADGTIPVWKW